MSEEFSLAAPAPDQRRNHPTQIVAPPEPPQPLPAAEARFSLFALLVLVTCAALVLAVGRLLAPPVFAGMCGAAAFVYLVLLTVLKVQSLTWHVGWWLLLMTYLGSAAWVVSSR
jgi:hypothetical protein